MRTFYGDILFFAISIYSSSISKPINFLFNFNAEIHSDPAPAKGARIISPSSEDDNIIRSHTLIGF